MIYKRPRSFELVSENVRDDAGKVRRTALRDERIAKTEGGRLSHVARLGSAAGRIHLHRTKPGANSRRKSRMRRR